MVKGVRVGSHQKLTGNGGNPAHLLAEQAAKQLIQQQSSSAVRQGVLPAAGVFYSQDQQRQA